MSDDVYLDHHSATPPLPEIVTLFSGLSSEYFGALDTPHFIGGRGSYSLQKAVQTVFEEIGASDDDDLFFVAKEEGVERLFFEIYLKVSRETGKTVYLAPTGAETYLQAILHNMARIGCSPKTIPLNDKGQITRNALESVYSPRAALVSIPWADGLTGVIHPVEEIAAFCLEQGVALHLDASYLLGKRFCRFQDIGAGYVSVDGGMIQSLPGTGFLWAAKGSSFPDPSRPPSVAVASSLALAVQERKAAFEDSCMEISSLRDLLEREVCAGYPGAVVIFQNGDRLPNVSVIAFPGVYHETLAYLLNAQGIYVSTGGGKFPPIEQVLEAAAVSPETARSTLVFALSSDTTREDVLRAAEVTVSSALRLKICAPREVR